VATYIKEELFQGNYENFPGLTPGRHKPTAIICVLLSKASHRPLNQKEKPAS